MAWARCASGRKAAGAACARARRVRARFRAGCPSYTRAGGGQALAVSRVSGAASFEPRSVPIECWGLCASRPTPSRPQADPGLTSSRPRTHPRSYQPHIHPTSIPNRFHWTADRPSPNRPKTSTRSTLDQSQIDHRRNFKQIQTDPKSAPDGAPKNSKSTPHRFQTDIPVDTRSTPGSTPQHRPKDDLGAIEQPHFGPRHGLS